MLWGMESEDNTIFVNENSKEKRICYSDPFLSSLAFNSASFCSKIC